MKILLVDDKKLTLESIKVLLYQQFPGSEIHEAHDGIHAVKMLAEKKPDVMLLDINMPEMNGLQVAEYINEKHLPIKIIVVTNVDGDAMVLSLVKVVHGFLFKDVDADEFKRCINTVMEGKKYFCEQIRLTLYENVNSMDKIPHIHLDKNEIELIQFLAAGKTSKEIAKIKGVKEKTINGQREALNKKTKTKNGNELVAYAFYNGLIN